MIAVEGNDLPDEAEADKAATPEAGQAGQSPSGQPPAKQPPAKRPLAGLLNRNMRGIVLGVVAVLAAVGVGYVIIQLAGQGSVQSNLGDNEFNAGDHLRRSEETKQAPLLFASLASGGRSFYLQHLGENPLVASEWYAFDAAWPGTECVLEWNSEAMWFEPAEPKSRECTGTGTGPGYEPVPVGVLGYDPRLNQHEVRIKADGDESDVIVRFVRDQPASQ